MKWENLVMIFGDNGTVNSVEFGTKEEAISYIENTLKAKPKKNALEVWETESAEIVLEQWY